ncbi:hypothetical protein D0C36_13820 [Mucilaginibacter conchicola]|uniref:DUF2007 domain-containing protein n=1 Tax=Mucilaginibacter conchicola TaxID=2303333 RepID=A0A372NT97_9SPHI|nr:hypothetical protein [Mucilaginibacter conchicola]RFZ92500.1 hypothetical protein D0C36_13820 [Mucilaginibacter conchicola]
MAETFITYRKFNDPALAGQLAETLSQHKIDYLVEQDKLSFNPTFYNDAAETEYLVKLKPADFERVNTLLNDIEADQLNDVDPDHYLFKFSNEELTDLIAKRDEWSSYDYLLAKKILKDRGVELDEERLSQMEEQRINELKTTEKPQTFWIVIGYFFALLGGIIGIFIGWHLSTYKRTLPNGERVFVYREADRKQGLIIFYLGITLIILSLILRMITAR